MNSSKIRGWHKSSYSGNNGGDCVEVAETTGAALVRDTQHRDAGYLAFPMDEWSALLRSVRSDGL